MLRKILFILLPFLAMAGGIFAGERLRPPPAVPEPGSAEAATSDHGPDAEAEAAGHAAAAPESEEPAWFRFPTQFFVPLIRDGTVEAVMVLTLTVEMPKSAEEEIFHQEHRLRDALLRVLLIHANTGGFEGNFTADVHLGDLREKLLKAARKTSGDEIRAILIEDIARQDQ